MSHSEPVKTLDLVREEINVLRDGGMTYEAIGVLYGLSKGVIWNIDHGVEPTSPKIRSALGLEPRLHPTMYNEVRVCSVDGCDVPFIPNSPLRTKCFGCSPFKGGKR